MSRMKDLTRLSAALETDGRLRICLFCRVWGSRGMLGVYNKISEGPLSWFSDSPLRLSASRLCWISFLIRSSTSRRPWSLSVELIHLPPCSSFSGLFNLDRLANLQQSAVEPRLDPRHISAQQISANRRHGCSNVSGPARSERHQEKQA